MAVTYLGVVGSTVISGASFSIPIGTEVPHSTRDTPRHVLLVFESNGHIDLIADGPITDTADEASSPYRRCEFFPGSNVYYETPVIDPGFTVATGLILSTLRVGDTIDGTFFDSVGRRAWALAFEGAYADTDISFGGDLSILTGRAYGKDKDLSTLVESTLALIDPCFYDGAGGDGNDGKTWTTEIHRTSRSRRIGNNDDHTWLTDDGGQILTIAAANYVTFPAFDPPTGLTGYAWENIDMVTLVDDVNANVSAFAVGMVGVDEANVNVPIGGYWTGSIGATAIGGGPVAFVLRPGLGPEPCPGAIEGTVIIVAGEAAISTDPPEPFGPAAAGRVSFTP